MLSENGARAGIDSRSRARGSAPRLRRACRPAGLPHPELTRQPSCLGALPRSCGAPVALLGSADWQTAALLLRYARINKLAPASSGCWQAPEKIRQGRSGLRFRINNRRFLKEIVASTGGAKRNGTPSGVGRRPELRCGASQSHPPSCRSATQWRTSPYRRLERPAPLILDDKAEK